MSLFHRLEAMASNTEDRIHAERFKHTPRKQAAADPNGRRNNTDPDRPERDDLWGIFEYLSIEYGIQLGVRKSYREANDLRAVSEGRKPMLSVDRKYFATKDLEPRQGDLITMLNDDGTVNDQLPQFEVEVNQRDGKSRFELVLVQRGQQG